MKRLYLDSNILIAYYAKDKSEKSKKKMVSEALQVFSNSKNVKLFMSMWGIAEMVNILISQKKMNSNEVAEIENNIVNERRLQDIKIEIITISPKKDYDFLEFFYHVRQGILKYHSGVGDIIHSVIMKNYGIKNILTFDEGDFVKIPDLTVLNPKIIKRKNNVG